MKGVLSGVALFLFCSCQPIGDGAKPSRSEYKIIEIEGCEYIVFETSVPLANNYSFAITHKGNCKNPIHHKP